MAYDKEKALEALILRVIRQVLAEQAQAKRRLYVSSPTPSIAAVSNFCSP